MRKLLLILITALITSCQYTPCTPYKVEHKVVEKFHTQDRDGRYVYYKLLFDNGEVEDVDPEVYARNNVGDVWVFSKCK